MEQLIAQALFLSKGTVRNHIFHILNRSNVRDGRWRSPSSGRRPVGDHRTQAAIVANTFLSWLENPELLRESD